MKTEKCFASILTQSLVNDSSVKTPYTYWLWGSLWGKTCCSV